MIGPISQPGQREVTHVGTASEVETPWQIWVRSSKVDTIRITLVTCGVLLTVLAVAYHVNRGRWVHGYQFTLWQTWRVAFRTVWDVFRYGFVVPMWLVIASWCYRGWQLIHYRYEVEQRNRNWPPPYGAVDVEKVGLLDADNAHELTWTDPPEPERRIIEVRYHDNGGKRETRSFLPDVPGLVSFARAAMNGQGFSERTAARFGISRQEYNEIRDEFLDRGWIVWNDDAHPRQGLELLAAGRAVLRRLSQPSPTL